MKAINVDEAAFIPGVLEKISIKKPIKNPHRSSEFLDKPAFRVRIKNI